MGTVKGEKHPKSKLTEEAIRIIREDHGNTKLRELAERFGVSIETVHDAKNRRSWKHIK